MKELTKRPLMQANSKVLSPPIPLHAGSLHFDTLLKLQITQFFFFFLATQRLILRKYFSRDSDWHMHNLAARSRTSEFRVYRRRIYLNDIRQKIAWLKVIVSPL